LSAKTPSVLIVDDDPELCNVLLRGLGAAGYDVQAKTSATDALASIEARDFDVVVTDIRMPKMGGLALCRRLSEVRPDIPVVVITAFGSMETAIEAMRAGAYDFVVKPFELEAVRAAVRRAYERRSLLQKVHRLEHALRGGETIDGMVGGSVAMQPVYDLVQRVAGADATVVITGESGTGKELVARAIHDLSPRCAGPFIAVNCGAISSDLIESELFGHEKGAFTGAIDRRIGRIESANKGTLFLDEIGELEPALQVKLLRALQERTFERVGSSSSISVDVRIVAATNRDLAAEVAAGRFREDLYYRIAVVPVKLPPLRDRREDIRLLAQTFLARIQASRAGLSTGGTAGSTPGGAGAGRAAPTPKKLSAAALGALDGYRWPGNVRELENAIEHGLALCDGDTIDLKDLPLSVGRSGQAAALRELWRQGERSFDDTVTRFETEILREALESHQWNQTRTANALGITRRVLKLKMDKLGIESRGGDEAD
jgi:DNA-binding NtrC family response regulator